MLGSALAGEQCRALTARAARQIVQLLWRWVTIELGFLADDHWLVLFAGAAYCRLLTRCIITPGRAVAATAIVVTTSAATVVVAWALVAAGAALLAASIAALALATTIIAALAACPWLWP